MEIMAKFLNSGTAASHLEDLIAGARQRLVLINPHLKFSGRTKNLLTSKSDLDVRLVYGKCDLRPDELNSLRALPFVRTHFCRDLTATCYLNEEQCIVTSLDLFDFGQVMNNEMGVLISRTEDPALYNDAAEEAERILAASEEVRIRVEKVDGATTTAATASVLETVPSLPRPHLNGLAAGKLSTHRLAKKLGLKTHELLDGLQRLGAIEVASGHRQLTARGLKLGGEFRSSARFGDYFVWPENFELSEVAATNGAR